MTTQWVGALGMALVSTLGPGCDGAAAVNKEAVAVVKGGTSNAWWKRFSVGVADGMRDLGLKASMVQSATSGDVPGQIALVEGLINRKVPAIIVDPDGDPTLMEPTLQKARAAGILVLTHEVPDQVNKDWDVETIDNTKFAQQHFDKLTTYMGTSGKYAVFTGGSALHAYWANAGIDYVKKTFPNLVLVRETVGQDFSICGEADAMTHPNCGDSLAAILAAHADLKGLVIFGANGPVTAAAYLKAQANTSVNLVGVAAPSAIQQYMKEGYMKEAFLWDPRDSAYSLVYIANELLNKRSIATLTIADQGAAVVDSQNHTVTFNKNIDITPANVDALNAQLGF